MKRLVGIVALVSVLVSCDRSTTLQPHPKTKTGGIVASVMLSDQASKYTLLANGKVLGDVIDNATVTLSNSNSNEPLSKTITRSQWTNTDGTYKPISFQFTDILPGDVLLTIVGAKGNNTVLTGSGVVTVVADTVAPVTLNAKYVTGSTNLGLDLGTPVVQPK